MNSLSKACHKLVKGSKCLWLCNSYHHRTSLEDRSVGNSYTNPKDVNFVCHGDSSISIVYLLQSLKSQKLLQACGKFLAIFLKEVGRQLRDEYE